MNVPRKQSPSVHQRWHVSVEAVLKDGGKTTGTRLITWPPSKP